MWLKRLLEWGRCKPTGEDVTVHHDHRRFAKIRTSRLSFGSALVLGFSLDHAEPKGGNEPKYNGSGLTGDRDAIAGDFRRAITKAGGHKSPRG